MHVVCGLGTGGTEMMCLRLVRHWQYRFHQTVVALSPGRKTLEGEFRSVSGLTLDILPATRDNVEFWTQLRAIIRKSLPDALLIHVFGKPHLIAASAARMAGVRAIAVWAGNPPPSDLEARRRWGAVLLASRLLRVPVMSCSHAVDRELRHLRVGMPLGSAPIPNGIDTNEIARHAQRARQARSGRPPVIGMAARLESIKDHGTLLRAFSILRDENSDAELWLAGDGPLRASLEDQAVRLGIALPTRFLGDRSDVPHLLGQLDVCAFSTTREEGFGIALIEAMAAGIPIAASNVPACREVLAGGDAGVLVPPENPKALARAIADLLENRELRARMTEAALARVRLEYSIEACAKRWEAVLFPVTRISAARELECAS
jgi:glycosyltransferase involved in cell wall biosynthesis